MDFTNDVAIDQSGLDVELLRQPTLILQYSKYAADMKMVMQLAKENIDLVKGELDKKIRSNPERYEIEKLTEAVVLNTINAHPKYRQAVQDHIDASYEHEIARGALSALEHKKEALSELVRLFGQNYFAGPSLPRDLSAEWLKTQSRQKADAGVAGAITRRRKQ